MAIERLLAFGRDLQSLYSRLTSTHPNEQLKAMLQVRDRGLAVGTLLTVDQRHLPTPSQDSFSLLAYTDPKTSPVGYLLDPIQREPVSAALNSAILGGLVEAGSLTRTEIRHLPFSPASKNLPGQPPLEFALGQAAQSLKHMSRNGVGAAAFTGVQDVVNS